jgi:hypothetical protein
MVEWSHMKNGNLCGLLFVLILGLPVMANGEKSTPATGEKNAEVSPPAEADSGLTFSDVMNWAQRFGNRVGENISEAASKTASAIKKAAADNKQQSQSENSP